MTRAAVVTGVSRRNGIGFAVARRLLEAGNGVLVHSWAAEDESPDPGGLEAVLAELSRREARCARRSRLRGSRVARERSWAPRGTLWATSTSSS